jgi:SAM-dependent methyltransferase
MNTDLYLAKENYITTDPNPDIWIHHANTKIMETCQYYIHGVVADFGPNNCSTTAHLFKYQFVKHLFAFDINNVALSYGYQMLSSLKPIIPFNLITCNLTEIPIDDNTFDFAMSFHTLEHIFPDDANKVVSEMYRTIKPGGHILISIPYDHAYPDICHVAFYKVDSLCELFEKNGFEVVYAMRDSRFDQKDLLTALFKKN